MRSQTNNEPTEVCLKQCSSINFQIISFNQVPEQTWIFLHRTLLHVWRLVTHYNQGIKWDLFNKTEPRCLSTKPEDGWGDKMDKNSRHIGCIVTCPSYDKYLNSDDGFNAAVIKLKMIDL